jgi:hypothetical protein
MRNLIRSTFLQCALLVQNLTESRFGIPKFGPGTRRVPRMLRRMCNN